MYAILTILNNYFTLSFVFVTLEIKNF